MCGGWKVCNGPCPAIDCTLLCAEVTGTLKLPHFELTGVSVIHCRSCEVMEEEEEEEEEGEDGEEMEERRDLEEEGLGTEPRPLEGAVSTLRQENALLRLELGKLQQLVEEKAQIGG